MNKKETVMVLTYLGAEYDGFFSKMKDADRDAKIALWYDQFRDYEGDAVMAGARAYISTNTTGYPPKVGQLKELIYKLQNQDEMTELEAWGLVKSALRNSGYFAQDEWEKLPPVIQKLVDPHTLHEWAMMDSDEVNTVVASNFMRSYRMRAATIKDMQKLPGSMKEMISTLVDKAKLLKGGEDEDQ